MYFSFSQSLARAAAPPPAELLGQSSQLGTGEDPTRYCTQVRATRDRRIRVTASYSRQILYNCIWTGHWNEAVTRMQLNIVEFPCRNGSGLKWPLFVLIRRSGNMGSDAALL